MQSNKLKEIKEILSYIYPEDYNKIYNSVKEKINLINTERKNFYKLSNNDSILITYADNLYRENEKGLKTLNDFSEKYLKDSVNTIHILPFFPYSSDDGFSVIDYKKVAEGNGDWNDIETLSEKYRLMFDAVINHVSKKSSWFREYLKGNSIYEKYFLELENTDGFNNVVRPRTHSLLTEFKTSDGYKKIWTTFSEDQIDLNYKNPDVLSEIIDILLFYAEKGAKLIRLDAIGFLWKEKNTSCIHLEKTHKIIKLIRKIFELTYSDVLIVTETNVPHEDNISYFGNGNDEAHMIYNFTLPPLLLYTYFKHDSEIFSEWLKSISSPSENTAYFNFLASHDGIGLRPLEGIIDEKNIEDLTEDIKKHGGLVSYKKNPNGTKSPYELNINLFSAFGGSDTELSIRKFISAYAIACFIPGIPGVYIHSLLGSQNYYKGVENTGQNRSINREKLDYIKLSRELENKESTRYKIFSEMKKLLKIRKDNKEFDPFTPMEVIKSGKDIICFERDKSIRFILNISEKIKRIDIDGDFSYHENNIKIKDYVILKPYEFILLKRDLKTV